ncbi:MAG: peptide chain release factor N(5)-glutamine methyltransferase, partial [Patescibacteria group bacterium]|nr:peptide chain release factor N(5)-glutamine methyltransferase [Patescibacteria group bacterium]
KKLAKIQITNYKLQITQRVKGGPIAYITGHKEFYGLDFFVNKNVLIPRPETELMVDEALKEAEPLRFCKNRRGSASTYIIDVGTGSGCIIITLAKKLKELSSETSELSSFNFFAVDISSNVLYIAKKNAKLHGVNKQIKFYQGNLIEHIINKSEIRNPHFARAARGKQKSEIIITANLPYLTPAQIKNSPTIQKEPELALAAGNDGLKYYRELFNQIKTARLKSREHTTLYLEIDHSQKISISKLIKQNFPQAKFQIKKDLRDHYRLVCVSL